MRIIPISLLLTLGLTASVQFSSAQPAPAKPPEAQPRLISGLPVESVTVVATKPSEETIKNFVETRAAPTRVLGKMAYWTSKICPKTVGLGDKYAKYVTQRIRDIATAAGAPVNADPACRPNVEVVFTTTPQGLMDNVAKRQMLLLGYHHTLLEAVELTKVTHPIQAWYATETMDIDGSRMVDVGRCGFSGSTTLNIQTDAQTPTGVMATAGVSQLELPCAIVAHVSGSRINNGLTSGFFNVLIVAEPTKLLDYEVGSLADYISMLALSQPASLDSCLELPSISNMLAPGCASVSSRITDGDLAYLHALYKMPDGTSLTVQRDEIMYRMKKTLVTDKGGVD
jgi:hypothetical protein